MTDSTCPTCGSNVTLREVPNGTNSYTPLTDHDLTYRIEWALQVLDNPSANDEQGISDGACIALAKDILRGAIHAD